MGGGFLFDALKAWLGKKAEDKRARAEYDARYTNNPRFQFRNQILRQIWKQYNLADRFKDSFPDPNDPQYAGRAVRTPENVLLNLTNPPRFGGRPGTGFDFASTLLQLGGRAAMEAAAGQGGAPPGITSLLSGQSTSPTPTPRIEDFDEFTNYQIPQNLDPFRFRRRG